MTERELQFKKTLVVVAVTFGAISALYREWIGLGLMAAMGVTCAVSLIRNKGKPSA